MVLRGEPRENPQEGQLAWYNRGKATKAACLKLGGRQEQSCLSAFCLYLCLRWRLTAEPSWSRAFRLGTLVAP